VYSKESIAEALDLFQQAIAIDPDYALAWAGIADCHGQNIQWSFTDDHEEEKRLGLEAARRAIALNPRLAEAHKAEALMLRFTGDTLGARAANLRAVEVNPRFTPALINLAVDTFCRGDLAGAERIFRYCVEIDPQENFGKSWVSVMCELTGRRDEGVSWAEQFAHRRDSAPWYFSAQFAARAARALHRGETDAAVAAIEDADRQGADPPSIIGIRAAVLAYAGRIDQARATLDLADRTSLTGLDLQNAAIAALRLGDVPRARAFMGRKSMFDIGPMLVRLDVRLHPLLQDAAYAPIRFARPLVWPVEAPMMDAALLAVFDHVRIDTGRPSGSNVIPKA
jgi:tetratricopeptide (TPR) repeat protein